jgi:hypothetical protein
MGAQAYARTRCRALLIAVAKVSDRLLFSIAARDHPTLGCGCIRLKFRPASLAQAPSGRPDGPHRVCQGLQRPVVGHLRSVTLVHPASGAPAPAVAAPAPPAWRPTGPCRPAAAARMRSLQAGGFGAARHQRKRHAQARRQRAHGRALVAAQEGRVDHHRRGRRPAGFWRVRPGARRCAAWPPPCTGSSPSGAFVGLSPCRRLRSTSERSHMAPSSSASAHATVDLPDPLSPIVITSRGRCGPRTSSSARRQSVP